MGYDEFILIVNSSSIIILLMMALLLCSVSKFRGESSYAALIIVLTTVPVYTYNVCRSLGLYKIAFILAPLGFSVNLTLMPLLWLLVQRGFNPIFRLKLLHLLHFIPALNAIKSEYLRTVSLKEWYPFIMEGLSQLKQRTQMIEFDYETLSDYQKEIHNITMAGYAIEYLEYAKELADFPIGSDPVEDNN